VSQKGATKLMAVTSSNLNGFSKFFHHWKEKDIYNKSHILFSHRTLSVLPHYLWEFKGLNVVKLQNKIKNRTIFVKKRKFHSHGWMDVVIIIKVAQSVQHLLPHMREDANATRQLHCQWHCGPADAKHAAKRCYHFLCFLTVWTHLINRQNNKDGKFKDCSWLFFW